MEELGPIVSRNAFAPCIEGSRTVDGGMTTRLQHMRVDEDLVNANVGAETIRPLHHRSDFRFESSGRAPAAPGELRTSVSGYITG